MTPHEEPSPFGPAGGRPRSRVLGWLVFAVVLAGAGYGTWRATRNAAPPAAAAAEHDHSAMPMGDSARSVMLSEADAQRIGITYVVAEVGPLAREVRTAAVVAYDETRLKSVATRVDGWVERLSVNFTGQEVRAGEPLFTLYSPTLVAAQEELLLAKRLLRDVASGSPDAVQSATELLESARRRLLYWEVPTDEVQQIEQSGVVRKAITFRSPVSGVVIEKAVLAGQRVMAGEAIYRIADLSTVWLEGDVFERDLGSVKLGLVVSAELAALPGATRRGRITYIYPTVNPETRTARVRVELPNPGRALKPGMYATFRFTAGTTSVLSVPRSAVLSTGKRDLVFVKQPTGELVPRDVTLGLTTDDRIEILSGLSRGETVVASATFLLDAESNLGSLLGGMGKMPGMDISPPPAPDTGKVRPD